MLKADGSLFVSRKGNFKHEHRLILDRLSKSWSLTPNARRYSAQDPSKSNRVHSSSARFGAEPLIANC
jgi:hypothetical protein